MTDRRRTLRDPMDELVGLCYRIRTTPFHERRSLVGVLAHSEWRVLANHPEAWA